MSISNFIEFQRKEKKLKKNIKNKTTFFQAHNDFPFHIKHIFLSRFLLIIVCHKGSLGRKKGSEQG